MHVGGEVAHEVAAQRDLDGDRRDAAAAQRDHVAERHDLAEAQGSAAVTTDGLIRSALARRDAASDRRRSGEDEFVCAISGLAMADATKRLAGVETALAGLPGHGSVVTRFAELQPGDSREDVVARAAVALHPER